MRNILERAMWSAIWGFTSAIPVAQLTAAFAGGQLDAIQQLAVAGLGGGVAAFLSFLKTLAGERMGFYPEGGGTRRDPGG